MSLSPKKVPLGAVLQQAGLVSADDIKQALQEQVEDPQNRRIGEILAARGHINPKTADFFAENWSSSLTKPPSQPIGQYFKQAALLNDRQIELILKQQKQSKLKFGELAIAKGWLNPTTVDFFIKHLTSSSQTQPISTKPEFSCREKESFYKIKLKLLKLENRQIYSEQILERVLSWTGGQSTLTQQVYEVIEGNLEGARSGEEAERVDRLIQSRVIQNWRTGAAKEHLQTIEQRLLENHRQNASKLLQMYRQILAAPAMFQDSPLQQELLKIGLVVKQQEQLIVANRIYQQVFDSNWIQTKLAELKNSPNSVVALIPSTPTKIIASRVKEEKKTSTLKNSFLFLTLVTLMLVIFHNINRRLKVRTAFQKGNELLQQKSFQEAIAQYNQLLNIDSNYFQAWTNRGYALAGLQQYDAMRESCSTATIIDPTAVYAWNCQGEALHNLQREEEAIAAFDRAIALNQRDPIFLINKSESLKAIGKEAESLATISEAIAVLEKIEAIKGREEVKGEFAVALTFLGNGYRKKSEYEMALASYQRALLYVPQYFPAQIGKAIVYSRSKRYAKAQQELENILANPELSKGRQAQAWFYLGQALCRSRSISAGIEAFERALSLKPDYQAARQAKQNCS